jgi:L-alanine-DL-glutamate epimerase-like enolase superfamily enzyme
VSGAAYRFPTPQPERDGTLRGYTGFRRGTGLAAAHNREVSAHCAPALHAPIAAATPNLHHVEYFADHARLEPQLVEGSPIVEDGAIRPSTEIPGHGMSLRSGPVGRLAP